MNLETKEVVTKTYTLTLTEEEAQAIRMILGISDCDEFMASGAGTYGLSWDEATLAKRRMLSVLGALVDALPNPK